MKRTGRGWLFAAPELERPPNKDGRGKCFWCGRRNRKVSYGNGFKACVDRVNCAEWLARKIMDELLNSPDPAIRKYAERLTKAR